MRAVFLIVLLSASTAIAEPAGDYALAVNSPASWPSGFAVAASGYVRLDDHQALRLNVASYKYDENVVEQAAVVLVAHEGLEGHREGRLLDLGAGWMYFPRRAFEGPTFELGVLRRAGATFSRDDNRTPENVDRDTQLYAGRALVGWTWLIHARAMISLGLGAARGYEFGTEHDSYDLPGRPPMTREVAGWKTTVEGYLRFGVTFGT